MTSPTGERLFNLGNSSRLTRAPKEPGEGNLQRRLAGLPCAPPRTESVHVRTRARMRARTNPGTAEWITGELAKEIYSGCTDPADVGHTHRQRSQGAHVRAARKNSSS